MHPQAKQIQFVAKYRNAYGEIIYPFTAYLRYMASAHANNFATAKGLTLVSFGEYKPGGSKS